MPRLTVEGVGSFEVPVDKRVVLALEDEAGLDQLHACGGQARCTTCRVTVVEGLASPMTAAEQQVLKAKDLAGTPGLRLSCQMTMIADLSVRAESRLAGSGRVDAGKRPADYIEPPPVFVQGATDPQQENPDERAGGGTW
jgi:ferredoxin